MYTKSLPVIFAYFWSRIRIRNDLESKIQIQDKIIPDQLKW
jgi:hypothetical protein